MDEQATVSRRWESYRKKVMHPTAPPMQVHECQLAFYAGASSVLMILLKLGDEEVSIDEGAGALEMLLQEVQAFVAALQGSQGGRDGHKLH